MSVGHIARECEAAGIPTVVIATSAFRPRLETMHLPRLILTPYPMGRPLGAAGNQTGQIKTLTAALDLLQNATSSNSIIELDHPYEARYNLEVNSQ